MKYITKYVWPDEREVIICRLSSLKTQQMVQELLNTFISSTSDLRRKSSLPLPHSNSNVTHSARSSSLPELAAPYEDEVPKKVMLIIVNMQETTKRMINHLRVMIEDAEQATSPRKLFVILMHFPPSKLSGACYPSTYLEGWNHYYLDTIGYSADITALLNVNEWLQLCCKQEPNQENANKQVEQVVKEMLREPENLAAILSSSVPVPIPDSKKYGSFNRPMSPGDRIEAYIKLFKLQYFNDIICKLFCSYWNPKVVTEHLERASFLSYQRESSMSISDSLSAEFKSKFMDFLLYIVLFLNNDFGLDNLLSDPPPSQGTIALYCDLLESFSPVPPLSHLKECIRDIASEQKDQKERSCTTFPFFTAVCGKFEAITNSSHESACRMFSLKKPSVHAQTDTSADLELTSPQECSWIRTHGHTFTIQELTIRKLTQALQTVSSIGRYTSKGIPQSVLCVFNSSFRMHYCTVKIGGY